MEKNSWYYGLIYLNKVYNNATPRFQKTIYPKPVKYKIYAHFEIYVLYIKKYMDLSRDQFIEQR